jgi:phage terminase small subunit
MTPKQKLFIHEYLVDFNATKAAIRAGYSERTAYSIGHENLSKPEIASEIEKLIDERVMTADEVRLRLGRIARFDISDYIEGYGKRAVVRTDLMIEDGYGDLIRGIKHNAHGSEIKTADPDWALERIAKEHGMDKSTVEHEGSVDMVARIVEKR